MMSTHFTFNFDSGYFFCFRFHFSYRVFSFSDFDGAVRIYLLHVAREIIPHQFCVVDSEMNQRRRRRISRLCGTKSITHVKLCAECEWVSAYVVPSKWRLLAVWIRSGPVLYAWVIICRSAMVLGNYKLPKEQRRPQWPICRSLDECVCVCVFCNKYSLDGVVSLSPQTYGWSLVTEALLSRARSCVSVIIKILSRCIHSRLDPRNETTM